MRQDIGMATRAARLPRIHQQGGGGLAAWTQMAVPNATARLDAPVHFRVLPKPSAHALSLRRRTGDPPRG